MKSEYLYFFLASARFRTTLNLSGSICFDYRNSKSKTPDSSEAGV